MRADSHTIFRGDAMCWDDRFSLFRSLSAVPGGRWKLGPNRFAHTRVPVTTIPSGKPIPLVLTYECFYLPPTQFLRNVRVNLIISFSGMLSLSDGDLRTFGEKANCKKVLVRRSR